MANGRDTVAGSLQRAASLSVAVASIVALFAVCASAFGQVGRPDARAEIWAALYAASATQAAAERAADGQLRAMRTEIERLRSAGASAQAALSDAQERFVAALADRDRAYGEEIAVFRAAVEDISRTPRGVEALARFNSGDEVGALAILDRLVDARERARRRRADIETAAERRRIASLALEARGRGRLSTQDAITRFEIVTSLDDGVFSDWLALTGLYRDAGALTSARAASDRALRLAETHRERISALTEAASLDWAENNRASAIERLRESLQIAEQSASERPGDESSQLELALARRGYGDAILWPVGSVVANTAEALPHLEAAAATLRRLATETPSNVILLRELALCEMRLSSALDAAGDRDEGQRRYAEFRTLLDRIVQADPDGADVRVFSSMAESNLASRYWSFEDSRDLPAAERHYRASLELMRELTREDPTNVRFSLLLAERLVSFSSFYKWSGYGNESELYALADEALELLTSLRERGLLPASYEVYYALAGGNAMRPLPVPGRAYGEPN
jgi:hypothetical protein